jgi:LuxR family maltose regulon positive regulatory protein
MLARIFLLKKDLDAADRELQVAVSLLHEQVPVDLRCEVETQQVRVFLARNVPSAAIMILERYGFSYQEQFSFPDPPPGSEFTFATAHLFAASLLAILLHAPTWASPVHLRAGIRLANRLIKRAVERQYPSVSLVTLVLRAQMETNLVSSARSSNAGRADYVRALEIGQTENFITVFLEQGSSVAQALSNLQSGNLLTDELFAYSSRILDAFAEVQRGDSLLDETNDTGGSRANETLAQKGAPVEPLTRREIEVIALMSQGQKYREIATNLVISVNTVRYHVKAIYAKLGVNNRTQALEAARQLRIL